MEKLPPLEVFDCEQGSDAWRECRRGIITASEMHKVMASGKKGEDSKTRAQYMRQLCSETISGDVLNIFKGNDDTERGNEIEPKARELYEATTGYEISQVGFMRRGRIGASPDALVGEDGGAEIKGKRGDIHIEVLLAEEMPTKHVKQIQTCLYVSGRKWWDFTCYTPKLPLFIKRIERDEEFIGSILAACDEFNEELDAMVTKIRGMF